MMARFRMINMDPDIGGSQGGGSQSAAAPSAAPQTAEAASGLENPAEGSQSQDPSTQIGSAGNAEPTSIKALADRLMAGERLSPEELSRIQSANLEEEFPDDGDDKQEQVAAQPAVKAEVKPGEIPEAEAKNLTEAMHLLGAKDVSEIPAKVSALLNKDRSEGGVLGRELKNAKTVAENQHSLISDILDGKPEAIAFAEKATGKKFSLAQPSRDNAGRFAPQAPASNGGAIDSMLMSEEEIANSLDPDMAREMNKRLQSVSQAMKAQFDDFKKSIEPVRNHMEQTAQAAQRERAQVQVVDDLVGLSQKFTDVYGVKTGDVRSLLADFGKTGVADPRIQPLIATARFMVENNLPSIEIAHKVMHFDKVSDHTPKVLAAKAETRAKILNQPTPKGIAGTAQGGNKTFSDSELQKMSTGALRIPDEWLKPGGGLDFEKIPADVREKLGF